MIFSVNKQKIDLFIEKINPNLNNIHYTHFSNYRIEKINNSKSVTQKNLNIQTELLLNKAINYNSKQFYSFPEIQVNEQGKPSFTNLNIDFNISHSNNYLVVGISNKAIGVDLELINNKHLKVAKKLFNENDYIKYKNDINEIIKVWTIKEAYIKLFGSTMLISLKNIVINKNVISGPYGKAYFKTIKYNNYYLTVASLKAVKLNIYGDKDINI